MGQVLHGSAKTTHAVRAAIRRSKAVPDLIRDRGASGEVRPQPEDGHEVAASAIR